MDHTTGEIHDILLLYYKVAHKRFADNVYDQAVDHILLRGEESPLRVFCHEWVIGLYPEQLEAIAGEKPGIRERRKALIKKIEDLEAAIKYLEALTGDKPPPGLLERIIWSRRPMPVAIA